MKGWKKTSKTLGIMGLSALLLFIFPTSQVYAKDSGRSAFNVDCDLGQSIQEAVDKADDGAIINVYGSCTEFVYINKDRIWLKGTPSASISPPENQYISVNVSAMDVKISDFGNIEGDTQEGWIDGIGVYNSGSATIRNNVITATKNHSIEVGLSSSAIINNNLITGSYSGVVILGSSYARIRDNFIINNNGSGIGIHRSSSAQIGGNTISGNGASGIDVSSNSSIVFPGYGGENIINGNSKYGVICGTSGAINIQLDPDFTGGNDDGNLYILPGCDCRSCESTHVQVIDARYHHLGDNPDNQFVIPEPESTQWETNFVIGEYVLECYETAYVVLRGREINIANLVVNGYPIALKNAYDLGLPHQIFVPYVVPFPIGYLTEGENTIGFEVGQFSNGNWDDIEFGEVELRLQ